MVGNKLKHHFVHKKGDNLEMTNKYLKIEFDLYFIQLKVILKFQINLMYKT